MTISKRFILVIDTDSYSGNFEREMCAHITGQIGECGVGSEYRTDVDDLKVDYPSFDVESIMEWFDNNTVTVPDEHGCWRPCKIYPTEGRSNNGNGVHYDVTSTTGYKWPAYESVAIYLADKPSQEIFDFIVARAKDFKYLNTYWKGKDNPVIKNVKVILETTAVTSEDVEYINS